MLVRLLDAEKDGTALCQESPAARQPRLPGVLALVVGHPQVEGAHRQRTDRDAKGRAGKEQGE